MVPVFHQTTKEDILNQWNQLKYLYYHHFNNSQLLFYDTAKGQGGECNKNSVIILTLSFCTGQKDWHFKAQGITFHFISLLWGENPTTRAVYSTWTGLGKSPGLYDKYNLFTKFFFFFFVLYCKELSLVNNLVNKCTWYRSI